MLIRSILILIKKSIVSVSKGENPNKRLFQIKKQKLRLYLGKKIINNLFQMNGNFYFASTNFIKVSILFKDGKTYPIILKSRKLAMDIDTIKDFRKVEKYLKNS